MDKEAITAKRTKRQTKLPSMFSMYRTVVPVLRFGCFGVSPDHSHAEKTSPKHCKGRKASHSMKRQLQERREAG